MRVVFNGLASLKPKTGVGHYIENLYRHFPSAAHDDIVFYPHGTTEQILRGACRRWFSTSVPKSSPKSGSKTASSFAGTVRSWFKLSKRFTRGLARFAFRKDFQTFCRRHTFDLYHEPNFLPWPSDVPTITTIHDLSVLRFPQWHPADRVRAHEEHFFRAIGNSRHFIAVSEFTRQEMIRYLGIEPQKITAIHNGIGSQFHPMPPEEVRPVLRRFQLPADYLLFVGTIEPRKNILMLLKAYVALPAELRARHPLVLAGGWGWHSNEIRDYFDTTASLAGVIHCGYVPDDCLPALYNGARALVYPSHYEGFGLPPVEMRACGGAVIASDAGAITEVLSDSPAPQIDPRDMDGWHSAMRRILIDHDWVLELRRGATSSGARYTWERSAHETLQVYRQTLAVC